MPRVAGSVASRVAVLGASTFAGAFTPSADSTFATIAAFGGGFDMR